MSSLDVLTPYARSLGIAPDSWENDVPMLSVGFSDAVAGRPGAMHGGAISGLLETAGYALLRARLANDGRQADFVPINITVQFLRAGNETISFASARIVKLGRRTANLTVEAWQADRSKPIATAVMNIMLRDRG